MHHPMPFGKVPVSCCRTFLWHLPGARMQAGHLQADFRRPWALQMWGIYGNITNLCLNCLQFTSNRIYWLLFWVEMSSPSCLPLHDWHVRGWPRIRLAKWLTHHATTATTAATKQLPLSSFLPCELVVSLAHWTSCVCVWVPVYCSSWNSCPQGLKRTHCKTTKNIQEPYQEQVCLQKSMNSWSLAASGRAELSICGALTATNNRVLSNRVIAASSLNWFGLPPLSFLWCCYTIPSIYRPCSE